ncbi:AcrR family transcriptional regulator [Streptococcus rupicaprae]|uniref:AcrR family transcriptional regulator n=1 Tax=Streptococcus rupicaprae TaxID=759619 RepID=A0ABV2FL41_9STRE
MGQKRARTPQEIDDRKQLILERAKELFLTIDYADLTLVAIAKDLELSRPAVYHYFRSKEELFLALLKEEYLACEQRLQEALPHRVSQEQFCQSLVDCAFDSPLFIKLLSLHASALEAKLGYDFTYQFKKDTLPFFKTIYRLICQQFPQASEASIRIFMTQYNLLMTTCYQYSHIPDDQRQIMAELKPFGDLPFLEARQFFSQTLYSLIEKVQ